MKLNFAMFRIKLNKSVYIISVLYTVLLWNCKNTGHSSDLRINNDSLFNISKKSSEKTICNFGRN